jgi:hypothetical protein
MNEAKSLAEFLSGHSEYAVGLFHHFVEQYRKIGDVSVHPAKTMIGIATPRKRIAYVTQLGKNFIHIVFPFEISYDDNFCFQKIAKVPGDNQYNHHFRMLRKEDINKEVRIFMKRAFDLGS